MTKIKVSVICWVALCIFLCAGCKNGPEKLAQDNDPDLEVYLNFDNTTKSIATESILPTEEGKIKYTKGLEGKALFLNHKELAAKLTIENSMLNFKQGEDFTVQFWIKTEVGCSENAMLLSNKNMMDLSLASQKKAGWSVFLSGGTFGWNMGSGKRRISYMHDGGGNYMLNDGLWHQLTITYSGSKDEVGLFYDGDKKVTYKVNDDTGFDFSSVLPLHIGSASLESNTEEGLLPEILRGAEQVQKLVDEFHNLGLRQIKNDELLNLVIDPEACVDTVIMDMKLDPEMDMAELEKKIKELDLESIFNTKRELMNNPFTTYQSRRFMIVAQLLNIYSLKDGKVVVNEKVAEKYKQKETLQNPDIQIDELRIWLKEVEPEQVLASYSEYYKPISYDTEVKDSLIVADWNIWHGGIHHNIEEHGWDSRDRVIEMLEEEGADVIMMQETYSSGDYISAKLGYYYATATDWDYLNQGANISVISRYTIKEIRVPDDAAFMNVAARVELSENQDIWVMSNWYGMNKFQEVYDFHQSRFENSDSVPVLFAGDFNAVPHTDGGESLASELMMEAGFTDAFRTMYPDIEEFPGYSHRMGRRIDQLYYKGKGLKNTSIKVVSSWPTGFPSDHYLIVSEFDLNQ